MRERSGFEFEFGQHLDLRHLFLEIVDLARHAVFQDGQSGHFDGADHASGDFDGRLLQGLFQRRHHDRAAGLPHAIGVGGDEQRVLHVGHRRHVDPDDLGASCFGVERRLREQRRRDVDDHDRVRVRLLLGEEHLHLPLRIERRRAADANTHLAIEVACGGIRAGENFSAPFAGRQGLHHGNRHRTLRCRIRRRKRGRRQSGPGQPGISRQSRHMAPELIRSHVSSPLHDCDYSLGMEPPMARDPVRERGPCAAITDGAV